MSGLHATITLGLPERIAIGPIEIPWHGLTIALGALLGCWIATIVARERGLDLTKLLDTAVVLLVAGIVGTKLFYILQTDPSDIVRPSAWLSDRGFAFYGAIIVGVPAAALVLRDTPNPLSYLDAFALAFPAGMAIGRVGDLIIGEHVGPRSDLPWAVAYSNPSSEAPLPGVAYQSGALYEIVGVIVLFVVLWPMRGRLRTPGVLLCTVVAAYAVVRFAAFFVADDATPGALGLRQAQWTSLALVALALSGLAVLRHRRSSPGEGSVTEQFPAPFEGRPGPDVASSVEGVGDDDPSRPGQASEDNSVLAEVDADRPARG